MLFKLSNLNSNLALTLGYLNPPLNNSALQATFCGLWVVGWVKDRKTHWTPRTRLNECSMQYVILES